MELLPFVGWLSLCGGVWPVHYRMSGSIPGLCRCHLQLWQSEMSAAVGVQSLSCVSLIAPWTAARQASLSFTVSQSLLRLMSTESVMPSNHLIFCHSLLLLPSILISIGVFFSKLALHIRWPKYWSFSLSPFNENAGSISFRTDWFRNVYIPRQKYPEGKKSVVVENHQ